MSSASNITRLIVNARVATGDPRRPWADAIALADDVIVHVGASAALRKLVPPGVEIIDAKGATLSATAPLPAEFLPPR